MDWAARCAAWEVVVEGGVRPTLVPLTSEVLGAALARLERVRLNVGYRVLPDEMPSDVEGREVFLGSLDNVADPLTREPCADAMSGRSLCESPRVRVVQCGALRLGVAVESWNLWCSLLLRKRRELQTEMQHCLQDAEREERKFWSAVQLQGTTAMQPSVEPLPRQSMEVDEEGVRAPVPAYVDQAWDVIVPGRPHASDPYIPPLSARMPRLERQALLQSAQLHRMELLRRQGQKRVESVLRPLMTLPVYHPDLVPPVVEWSDVKVVS